MNHYMIETEINDNDYVFQTLFEVNLVSVCFYSKLVPLTYCRLPSYSS